MDDFSQRMLSSDKSLESTPRRFELKCRQCGSTMHKTEKKDKNLGLQLVGVVLFLLGVALLFVFPLGTVGGLILMVGAARLGYRKMKVWKCDACGYFFERDE